MSERDICSICDGAGERFSIPDAKCSHCNGTGFIEIHDASDNCIPEGFYLRQDLDGDRLIPKESDGSDK